MIVPKEDGWKNLQPVGSNPARDYDVCAAGGRAAAKVVHRKKALRDILDTLLALPAGADVLGEDSITAAAKEAAKEEGLTAYDAVSLAQIAKAAKGDTEAARWVRDSAGDKPTEKQQIVADVVTPADAEIAKRVAERLEKAKRDGE
jgi:hypothetical protein